MPTSLGPYYITVQDFENEVGRDVVVAYYDDNNDSSADPGPLRRLLIDSESTVEGFMRAAGYDLEEARLKGSTLTDVVRLALEVAVARTYLRHPEIARYDGDKAWTRIRRELLDIQEKRQRLDLRLGDPKGTGGGNLGRIGVPGGQTAAFFEDMGDLPSGRLG